MTTLGMNGAEGSFVFSSHRKENNMSNINVDTNKLHLEKMQEIMQAVDHDDAVSICRILVRRYPDVVLSEVLDYILTMRGNINALNDVYAKMGE